MKQLKSKTKLIARFLFAAIIGLSVLSGCKSYDKEIDKLNLNVADLQKTITDLKSTIPTGVDAKIADLTTQINDLKTRLAKAEGGVDGIEADVITIKADLVSKATQIAALEAFKTDAANKIAALETAVSKAATKEDIKTLETKIGTMATTLTTLTGKVDVLSSDLSKLKTDFTTAQGEIDGRILFLQGLLDVKDGKSAVLKDIYEKLRKQMDTIDIHTVEIQKLKADLIELKANTATLDDLKKVNDNMKKLIAAMNLNFDALSSRLTSLTYVADFYVNGIEAMNFSPLESKCKVITPQVVVAYHLNPSFITEADIDVQHMQFAVIKAKNLVVGGLRNAPAAETRVNANFVRLDRETGKIYVGVSVADYKLLTEATTNYGNYGISEEFNSIALQIPLSDKAIKENSITFNDADGTVVLGDKEYPKSRVITAQYVRMFSMPLTAGRDVYLAMNKPDEDYPRLPTTFAAAKDIKVEGVDNATESDPQVVILDYGKDKKLNLIDHVTAIYQNSVFDPQNNYGLKFMFDLKDEKGATMAYPRGGNKTDQQKFIKITDAAKGTIEAKVFNDTEIAASQGRTPIVRVWMYNDQDPTCPVLLGFVKVLLADKPLPKPIDVSFDIPTVKAGCNDPWSAITTVEQMNTEIYNKAGFSKTEFHDIYDTFTYTGDGTLAQILNPDDQSTDTYLLKWQLTATQIWDKLMASADGTATFNVKGVYTPKIPTAYSIVNVNFTVTFTKPAGLNLGKAELNKDYWYTTEASPYPYVKHNAAIPNLGETDANKCTFINNINQAFEQKADNSLRGLTNYEYYFLTQQPKHDDGTTLKVSADGKQLLNGTDVVATINPFVANVGDVLTLNKNSATAKRLLNLGREYLKARIGIRTVYCKDLPQYKQTVTINGNPYFDVIFVRPIYVIPNKNENFTDGVSMGESGSYLEVAKLVSLADWRNGTDYVSTFAKYPWFKDYYGLKSPQGIQIDVTKITTDMNQSGTKVPLTQYPDVQVEFVTSIPGIVSGSAYGYLTYKNNGNTLANQFNLYVPVKITYTWGEIVNTEVTIPVKKTVGPSGVKRK